MVQPGRQNHPQGGQFAQCLALDGNREIDSFE